MPSLGDVILKFRVNHAPFEASLRSMEYRVARTLSSIGRKKLFPQVSVFTKSARAFNAAVDGMASSMAKFADSTYKNVDKIEKKINKMAANIDKSAGRRVDRLKKEADKLDKIIAKGPPKQPTPPKQPKPPKPPQGIPGGGNVTAKQMAAYRKKLDKYYKNYATYARKHNAYNVKNKAFKATVKKRRSVGRKTVVAKAFKGGTTIMRGVAAVATRAVGIAVKAGAAFLKIGTGVISALNPMALFGKMLDGMINVFTGLGNAIISVAEIGLKAFVGAVAAGILAVSYWTKAAAEHEYAMVNIGRVAGLTKKSVDDLGNSLLKIGSKTGGSSAKDISDAAEFAARLGIGEGKDDKGKSAAIVSFVESLTRVKMALDDIPIEEAATKMARILNVFKLGPENIDAFASALVKLDNASTASGRDILEITRRISGVSSAMGISVQESMALATAMRDVGIDVEVGGTSIQNFFVRLSSDLKNFSRQLGIPREELKNLIDTQPMEAMRVVLGKLSQYSARDQAVLFTRLHLQGQRMTSTIWQLVKGFGKFDDLLRQSRNEWQNQEAIQEAVEARSQTLWAKLQKLWNQFYELSVLLGQKFLPVAKEIVILIGEFIAVIKKVAQESGWLDSLAEGIMDYVKLLRVFVADSKFATQYAAAIWAEKMALIKTKIAWLAGNWDSIRSTVAKNIRQLFQNMIDWFRDYGVPVFKAGGAILAEALVQGLEYAIASLAPAIADMLKQIPFGMGDGPADALMNFQRNFFGARANNQRNDHMEHLIEQLIRALENAAQKKAFEQLGKGFNPFRLVPFDQMNNPMANAARDEFEKRKREADAARGEAEKRKKELPEDKEGGPKKINFIEKAAEELSRLKKVENRFVQVGKNRAVRRRVVTEGEDAQLTEDTITEKEKDEIFKDYGEFINEENRIIAAKNAGYDRNAPKGKKQENRGKYERLLNDTQKNLDTKKYQNAYGYKAPDFLGPQTYSPVSRNIATPNIDDGKYELNNKTGNKERDNLRLKYLGYPEGFSKKNLVSAIAPAREIGNLLGESYGTFEMDKNLELAKMISGYNPKDKKPSALGKVLYDNILKSTPIQRKGYGVVKNPMMMSETLGVPDGRWNPNNLTKRLQGTRTAGFFKESELERRKASFEKEKGRLPTQEEYAEMKKNIDTEVSDLTRTKIGQRKVAEQERKKRMGMGGGPVLPELSNYRPEFVDLAEFSKKIQTDIYDTKKNDPMLEAMKQLVSIQERAEEGKRGIPKHIEDLTAMAKDGKLGGVLTA